MITKLITSLGLSLLAVSLVPHETLAAKISSSSYVNLKTDYNEQVSNETYTSVSTSANTSRSIASSEASWDLKFKTFASSEGEGLSYPAHGAAGFLGTFSLNNWEENYPLPITLNFQFTGSLNATSADGNQGSLGNASLSLLVETSDSIWSDTMQLQSQAGIPIQTSGSFFETNQYKLSSADPYIYYNGIKISLTRQFLEDIGVPPFDDFSSIDFVNLRIKIADYIYKVGLEWPNYIPPLTKVNVGFDIGVLFNASFNLSLDLRHSDSLFIVMQSIASSNGGASAVADFRNTLTLESITIPTNFELPPGSEPYIEFDSGLVVPVTKVQTVPEPLSILGSATALGFGLFFKRKLKPSQSTEKETTKVG